MISSAARTRWRLGSRNASSGPQVYNGDDAPILLPATLFSATLQLVSFQQFIASSVSIGWCLVMRLCRRLGHQVCVHSPRLRAGAHDFRGLVDSDQLYRQSLHADISDREHNHLIFTFGPVRTTIGPRSGQFGPRLGHIRANWSC